MSHPPLQQLGDGVVTGVLMPAVFDLGHQLGGGPLGHSLAAVRLPVHVAVLARFGVTAERNPDLPAVWTLQAEPFMPPTVQLGSDNYGLIMAFRVSEGRWLKAKTPSDLRRERDSNPRGLASQGFSRASHSAALPSLPNPAVA